VCVCVCVCVKVVTFVPVDVTESPLSVMDELVKAGLGFRV
jgi:hypothetical protein